MGLIRSYGGEKKARAAKAVEKLWKVNVYVFMLTVTTTLTTRFIEDALPVQGI